MKCKSCGDHFSWKYRLELFEKRDQIPHMGEEVYCLECADELFRNTISIRPAKLYSGGHGGGCDPDPSQENAVRVLEDK